MEVEGDRQCGCQDTVGCIKSVFCQTGSCGRVRPHLQNPPRLACMAQDVLKRSSGPTAKNYPDPDPGLKERRQLDLELEAE